MYAHLDDLALLAGRSAADHVPDTFGQWEWVLAHASMTDSATKRMNRHGRLFSYDAAAASYASNVSAANKRPSLRERCGISDAIKQTTAERQLKSAVWTVDTFCADSLQAEDDLSRLMQAG